ncbi:MAG: MBG domain-containing protein, partial [bacterium]
AWQAGNAIVFIITGSGRRTAWAWDGLADSAPRLHVEYNFVAPAPNDLPAAWFGSAGQTAAGEGTLVAITNDIFDADGDVCEMEVLYSTNSGAQWIDCSIRDAAATLGTVCVSNCNARHVCEIATTTGEVAATNTLAFSWDTTNSPQPVLRCTNTLIRLRAFDGAHWSVDVTSAPFQVDNRAWVAVTLDGLCQTYDGTPRAVSALTEPPGLTVNLTYNGSDAAPAGVGIYAVTGMVDTADYRGSTSDVLIVVYAKRTLTVDSSHGGESPGTLTTNDWTELSPQVTNSPASGGTDVQYVCTGATVSNNNFSPISPTNITITLTNDAVLTWLWKTQYLARATAGQHGTVTPMNSEWVDQGGTTTTYAASADTGFAIDKWYVNGVPVQMGGINFSAAGVTGVTTVLVEFAAQVATPTFSPDGGTFPDSFSVAVQCTTPDATIHYTTDGNDPTSGDPTVASGSNVLISRSTVLKAKAWSTGWLESKVKSATYTIIEPRISIVSPTNGTIVHFAPVYITTKASDSDGLRDVRFYNGTNLISTTNLTGGPLSWSNTFVWTGAPFGTNVLTARASNMLGNTTTSLPVVVRISSSVVCSKIFWQLPSGPVACWLINTNGKLKSSFSVYNGTSTWRVNGAGDLNKDDVADLFWQLPTGQIFCWLLNAGGTQKSGVSIYTGTSAWQIGGVGDMDSDGVADLIWQLSTGQVTCWRLNTNGTLKSAVNIFTGKTAWKIRGVGDIDSDGVRDLIWQLPTGQVACWFMNANGTMKSTASIYSGKTAWIIRGVGDIDGDSVADLIWQNPSGQVACWFMNSNGTAKGSANIFTGSTSWLVRAVGW